MKKFVALAVAVIVLVSGCQLARKRPQPSPMPVIPATPAPYVPRQWHNETPLPGERTSDMGPRGGRLVQAEYEPAKDSPIGAFTDAPADVDVEWWKSNSGTVAIIVAIGLALAFYFHRVRPA